MPSEWGGAFFLHALYLPLMERDKITVFDREQKRLVDEKVESELFIRLLYEKHPKAMAPLRKLLCGNAIFSNLIGRLQRTKFSKNRIDPFIEHHELDRESFEKQDFSSFDDFFVRELKKEARPICDDPVMMPCDARYLAYENFSSNQEIIVKGGKLSLEKLLDGDKDLTDKYLDGPFVVARLAPPDYHRFHFPVDGIPTKPKQVEGALYSVNPIALKHSLAYLTENKRSILEIKTEKLGCVMAIPVGATCVGSIHFTYVPDQSVQKGDEMGFFSFGGSTVIYLFEPGKVKLAEDILENSQKGIETLAKMGTPLGNYL